MLCRRWGCHASAPIETIVTMPFRNNDSCCCGAVAAAADVMLAVLTVSSVFSSGLMVMVVVAAERCSPSIVVECVVPRSSTKNAKAVQTCAFQRNQTPFVAVTLTRQSRTIRQQISLRHPSTDPPAKPLPVPRDVLMLQRCYWLVEGLSSRRNWHLLVDYVMCERSRALCPAPSK
jgi:hypothetical protein